MKNKYKLIESANVCLIISVIMIIPFIFLYLNVTGGAILSEDRVISVDNVWYHSHVTSTSWRTGEVTSQYTEIRIVTTDGSEYEFSQSKHMFDNPMYANIKNGWNFSHEKTIETGGKYRITISRSIFGGYTKDPFSNWNPNPEISKIVRLD